MPSAETAWGALAGDEAARRLDVVPAVGLASEERARRLAREGPNEVRPAPPRAALVILLDQLRSILVALLAGAAALSLALGDVWEAVAVAAVLVVNTAVGFGVELRATRSLEALARLGRASARVRRDGRVEEVASETLVPGDVVVLEAGDLVPADVRILSAAGVEVDESLLTGESLPVAKHARPAPPGAWGEWPSLAFKGTLVTRGSAEGLVVATGPRTELGRIAAQASAPVSERAPLQDRLDALGRWLALAAGIAAVAAGALAWARGDGHVRILEVGVSLAVAAVPEGLPIVATLALARGALRMASRNALVNRLSAIETLGSVDVLCVDKTGTLTENRMRWERVALADGDHPVQAGQASPLLREALTIAALCNNASVSQDGASTGDPTEAALLAGAMRAGLGGKDLARLPRVREHPFDPAHRRMATVHEAGGRFLYAVKGAPEAVLASCDRTSGSEAPLDAPARERWRERSHALAGEGLRILALASKTAASPDEPPYEGLALVGLAALADPPREGVREAIATCHEAGVRVVMITGDQPATAHAIARRVGIEGEALHGGDVARLFAEGADGHARLAEATVLGRMAPAQKLDLVRIHQERGSVVGMTGDGVNDAPALRRADVGVAMGGRGTQVAREAADVVLRDDSFPTLAHGIEEGRIVFGNVRRFVAYLLACNLAEVLLVLAALWAGVVVMPLQILALNLVTDVLPALALASGKGDPGAMRRPPRPRGDPLLGRGGWPRVLVHATVMGAVVALAYLVAARSGAVPEGAAPSVAFAALAFAQVAHVVNVADARLLPRGNEVTRNGWVAWASLASAALVVGMVEVGPVAGVLGLRPPGMAGWGLAVLAALATVAVGETLRGPLARLSRGR